MKTLSDKTCVKLNLGVMLTVLCSLIFTSYNVGGQIHEFDSRITELESDVTQLKTDVAILKHDVTEIKTDIKWIVDAIREIDK